MSERMEAKAEKIAATVRDFLGDEIEVSTVEGALVLNHRSAQSTLAEYSVADRHLTVSLMEGLPEAPELDGEALKARARELMGSRVGSYEARGYAWQEMEERPGIDDDSYGKNETPTVVIYLGKAVEPDELVDEVRWLVEEMPAK